MSFPAHPRPEMGLTFTSAQASLFRITCTQASLRTDCCASRKRLPPLVTTPIHARQTAVDLCWLQRWHRRPPQAAGETVPGHHGQWES